MATLTGSTIAGSYKDLLKIAESSKQAGLDATLRAVEDGDATASALYLATDSALISGNGTKLYFYDADGGEHISADNAGNLTIAAGAATDDLITLDSTGYIALNADGDGTVIFEDASLQYGIIENSSSDFVIRAGVQDKDLVFKGNDGGVGITAMTIDMSAGGNVGIGTAAPGELLHVYSGAGGGSTPTADRDILTVENDNHGSINIITPAAKSGTIYFSDDVRARGSIGYDHNADEMIFSTAASAKVTIDSAGNVGIGTADPGAYDPNTAVAFGIVNSNGKMLLSSAETDNSNKNSRIGQIHYDRDEEPFYWAVVDGTSSANMLSLGGGTTNGNAATSIKFYTSANYNTITGTERMHIDSGGDVTFTGDLIMADGKGIDFSANTDDEIGAGSVSAEILDDYEEGTWTGVISDGSNAMTMNGTYTTGYYTKVGNLVTISGYFIVTSLGSASGAIRMTGLPFTVADANAAYSAVSVTYGQGLNITAGHTVSAHLDINQTFFSFTVWDATTGVSSMTAAEWSADGQCMISATYTAA